MAKTVSNLNTVPVRPFSRLAVFADTGGGGVDFKKCTKCGEEKPLKDFFNHKTGRDGKSQQCKKCQYAISRLWRVKNKVRYNESERFSYNRNRIHILERSRLYYNKHTEQRLKSVKRYYIQHRNWRLQYSRRQNEKLTDAIIIGHILQYTPLERNQISPEHINLTRALIKLYRALNQTKT